MTEKRTYKDLDHHERSRVLDVRIAAIRGMGARDAFAALNAKRLKAEADGHTFRNHYDHETGELG